ncbi:MAG: TIR domain-containing protein [Desulfobacteraceae bacterium]
MSNIFISHSSRDKPAVADLQARLEEQGHHSVFLDLDPEMGIPAGVSWERTLYTKLRACRAVVALCSDRYLASQWCFTEIALARMEGKELFVLQINPWNEQTKMPSILTEEQYIDLRKDQDDGYQRLWNGFKVKGIVPMEARQWKPEEPPYPGMRAFKEEDAPIFFGRDSEIREGGELLNRVQRQGHPNLVMVLGSSGSGKSSLVRAGIVPLLRRDRCRWRVVKPFRPGQQPARELASSLSQAFNDAGQAFAWEEIQNWMESEAGCDLAAPPLEPQETAKAEPARERLLIALSDMEEELTAADEQVANSVSYLKDYLSKKRAKIPRSLADTPPPSITSPLAELVYRLRLQSGFAEATVVIVIDQFEELLGHDAMHPASRFLAMLRSAIEGQDSRLLIIGTMRSDYLGMLQRSASLQGLDFRSLSVGPIAKDGMRQIIEEPAKLGQIQLEKGLSDLLLEDTETSDALPLLAFTLRMMWDRYCDKRLFEIREYRMLGGLKGAVAQVADETLETALTLGKERDLRDAFLSLARPAAGGWARQATRFEDLAKSVHPMLQQFIDRRLLVMRADGSVEVAHEALFRSWNRLKGWLDENAEGLQLLREIQVDAAKWQKAATDEEKGPYLWRGGRLARALELRDGGVLAFKDLDKSFVEASEHAERAHHRRKRRVARLITGSSIAVALIMAMLAMGMHKQWQEALRLESLFLADAAERKLKEGDAVTSALLAHEGLQNPNASELRQQFRPYVREAEVSLNSAWGAQRERSILAGHGNRVSTAEFSPDGTRIVTASWDTTARVWDATTGSQMAVLKGHSKALPSATFSPDGTRIVTASWDATARVWDTTTGSQMAVLKGHSKALPSARFSPDGTRIATASWDATARVWDAITGSQICVLNHTAPVQSVAFSADGGLIVTASDDHTARVWDATTGRLITELNGHKKALLSATFGPDGPRIVTASLDATARVWNAMTGSPIAVLNHTGPVQSAVFSADGSRIVTASDDYTARVWDAVTGKPLATLRGHQRRVRKATFSRDGIRIITASDDETVRLWDAETGMWLTTFAGHTDWVWSAAFSPDGTRIVTTSDDKTARVWDAATVTILAGHKGIVRSAAFSPDGSRIITTSDDDTARLWDAATGYEVDIFSWEKDKMKSAAFSPNGAYIITASGDQDVQVWDCATGKKLAFLMDHPGQVRSAAFSADGTRIITTMKNHTVRVWDVKTRVPFPTLDGDKKAFSPDATQVVTVSRDNTARVWNATTGEVIHTLEGHAGTVRSAAFSPDGSCIVTGSRDNTARVWNTTTGEVIHTLKGHTAWVNSAVFSPDGARIVTASGTGDNTVRVWDATTGKLILPPLESHTDWVNSATFSPNGKYIVSRSEDKTARLWDAATGKLLTIFAGHPAGVRGVAFSPDSARIVTTSLERVARVWDIKILAKQVLIDRTKKSVHRCLTEEQRKQYFLPPKPPRWCVDLGKWPYNRRQEK